VVVNERGSTRRGIEPDAERSFPSFGDPDDLHDLFLRRLKRVLLLRYYTESLLSATDRRLLDRSIYSSYCDCLAVGVAVEARRLLSEARTGVGLFHRPATDQGVVR
jgi:hypothetical protein